MVSACYKENDMPDEFPAEVVRDRDHPQDWRVEKIIGDADGNVDITVFCGPDAEQRAREYATWKYPVMAPLTI